MDSKHISGLAAVIVVGVVALGWWAAPLAAQPQAETLGALLNELNSSGTLATIEFNDDVPRLGKSVDIGMGEAVQVERIGADIICFAVPGTAVKQVGGVPFSNIASVIYSERR